MKPGAALLGAALVIAACSAAPGYMQRHDRNTWFTVRPGTEGFGLAVRYARYWFVAEDAAVAFACTQAAFRVAEAYARRQGRAIVPVATQDVRLQVARDSVSGVTTCDANVPVRWR